VGIDKIENKNEQVKLKKTKRWFFPKINEINKPLPRMIAKEKLQQVGMKDVFYQTFLKYIQTLKGKRTFCQ
jgi:hypothetical protein